MDRLVQGSELAYQSLQNATEFIRSVECQFEASRELSNRTKIPIVTQETEQLFHEAQKENAIFGPSGAGGGDISIYFGTKPSSFSFKKKAKELGFILLDLRMDQEGTKILGKEG